MVDGWGLMDQNWPWAMASRSSAPLNLSIQEVPFTWSLVDPASPGLSQLLTTQPSSFFLKQIVSIREPTAVLMKLSCLHAPLPPLPLNPYTSPWEVLYVYTLVFVLFLFSSVLCVKALIISLSESLTPIICVGVTAGVLFMLFPVILCLVRTRKKQKDQMREKNDTQLDLGRLF